MSCSCHFNGSSLFCHSNEAVFVAISSRSVTYDLLVQTTEFNGYARQKWTVERVKRR
jgi:hypothetical protein